MKYEYKIKIFKETCGHFTCSLEIHFENGEITDVGCPTHFETAREANNAANDSIEMIVSEIIKAKSNGLESGRTTTSIAKKLLDLSTDENPTVH